MSEKEEEETSSSSDKKHYESDDEYYSGEPRERSGTETAADLINILTDESLQEKPQRERFGSHGEFKEAETRYFEHKVL